MVWGEIRMLATGGLMTKRLSTALCLVALPLTLMGCGKDCQSTCTKLYGTAPNCGDATGEKDSEGYFEGLVNNDQSREEKLSDCESACKAGLSKAGEVGDYDPYKRLESDDERPELENDRQVALWMECIDEHSCQNILDGYCEPTW